jgi:hypothetical protein
LCGVHNLGFTSVLPKLSYIHRQSIAFTIDRGGDMVSDDWESMTIDELFALREEVAAILKEKLMAKNKIAEERLRQLDQPSKPRRGKHRSP